MVNRFPHPIITNYFQEHDILVRTDLWALSDFLQWLYRSRIREGKPIDVYLPSQRMRGIFQAWLSRSDADIMRPGVVIDPTVENMVTSMAGVVDNTWTPEPYKKARKTRRAQTRRRKPQIAWPTEDNTTTKEAILS